MKIKFNSNEKLHVNKSMDVIIVVRAISLENNKYYPQVFLSECLYKL